MTTQQEPTILIKLNGKDREVDAGTSVAALLEELGLVEKLVVVERNGSIVGRSAFPDTILGAGDVLEVVHFVGGG